MSNFFNSLFGDPDYVQRMETEAKNENMLAAGDGKHFVVAWIGDQGFEHKFVCEWNNAPEAPCRPKDGEGCFIEASYDSIGQDMFETNEDESQLLKVRFPVGYRHEGYGEDFEDYLYSVRPKVPEGHTYLGHGVVSTGPVNPVDAAFADLPAGTEARDRQILDPETGTVHMPHGTVDIDGNVTLDE